MEIIESLSEIKDEFVVPSTTSFLRIEEVLYYMPGFAEKSRVSEIIEDIYYETPDKLLNDLGASVKIRKIGSKKYIHVVCYYFNNRKEYVKEIADGEIPLKNDDHLIFIEDKLQELYTHTVDADIIRMLTHLKPMFKCKIYRTTITYVNSGGLTIKALLDSCEYYSKRNTFQEKYLNIILESYPGKDEKFIYNRFMRELTSKVILIEEKVDQFQKGKQVMTFTKEKVRKSDLEDEEEEEIKEEEEQQTAKRGRSNF